MGHSQLFFPAPRWFSLSRQSRGRPHHPASLPPQISRLVAVHVWGCALLSHEDRKASHEATSVHSLQIYSAEAARKWLIDGSSMLNGGCMFLEELTRGNFFLSTYKAVANCGLIYCIFQQIKFKMLTGLLIALIKLLFKRKQWLVWREFLASFPAICEQKFQQVVITNRLRNRFLTAHRILFGW